MPEIYEPAAAEAFSQACRQRLDALTSLLRRRALQGYVRHCHGDLHLRNIVAFEGRPVLFDALEFDDRLATIDTLYDLAFLLMDLWFRGLKMHANRALNRYLSRSRTADLHGLAALPLFLALRAMIRSKADALRSEAREGEAKNEAIAEARRYFDLAQQLIQPSTASFVAFGGLSGTGKTTVARALAPRLGPVPGAVHLRSDVERKHLFGKDDAEHLPQEAYAQETTDMVYQVLRKKAAAVTGAGHSVIVDAVHGRPHERTALARVAEEHGQLLHGLWLTAQAETLLERVRDRDGDASDADEEVVKAQLTYDVGPLAWPRLRTDRAHDAVIADCIQSLGEKP